MSIRPTLFYKGGQKEPSKREDMYEIRRHVSDGIGI